MLIRMVLFICLGYAAGISAQEDKGERKADAVLSSVDGCIMDAPRCKEVTRRLQAEQPRLSRAWFRTTYLLMNAMWEIDRLSIPREEMEAYANIANSPAVFSATANTIYAKQLISDGDLNAGRQYADKAASMLLDMSGNALTPRRYADVIELYQYLGEYDVAQQLIDEALAQFSDIGKRYIKADLLTAAGHNAFHLKKWSKAMRLYQRSAEAHLEEKSLIGAAVAYANIGRVLQSQERWAEAGQAFIESIETYEKLQKQYPLRDRYYVELRLCEVLLEQGRTTDAYALFNDLQRHSLHAYHHGIYDSLATKLVKISDR